MEGLEACWLFARAPDSVNACARCGQACVADPGAGAAGDDDADEGLFRLLGAWEEYTSPGGTVRCAGGCGVPYCDEECRDFDVRVAGHRSLCLGPVGSEDHPLYRLRVASFRHRHGFEVTMAASALAAASVAGDLAPLRSAALAAAVVGQRIMKGEDVDYEADEEKEGEEDAEVHNLLLAAVPGLSEVVSLARWRALLVYSARCGVDVELEHPLAEKLREAQKVGGSDGATWVKGDNYLPLGCSRRQLLAEPGRHLPSTAGCALLLSDEIARSCYPNSRVVLRKGALDVVWAADRPRREDEPLTVAWRQPPRECACVLCAAFAAEAGTLSSAVAGFGDAELGDAAEWTARECEEHSAADLYKVLVERRGCAGHADVGLFWRLVKSLEYEGRSDEAERAARRAVTELGLECVGEDLRRYLGKLDCFAVAKCYSEPVFGVKVLFSEAVTEEEGGVPGFGTGKPLAVMSESAGIPHEECMWAITSVEKHIALHGWTTTRHASVPTTDVPVESVPELLPWFNRRIMGDLIPRLASMLLSCATSLRVVDAFFVKYSADCGQRGLPVHTDQGASCVSAVVAMNDDFHGGGTFFAEEDLLISPPAGSAVVFRGGVVPHGGAPVTKGTRYILALFLAESPKRETA